MKKYSNILESKLPWRYISRFIILTASLAANSWAIASFIPYQKNITTQKSISAEHLKISLVKASLSKLSRGVENKPNQSFSERATEPKDKIKAISTEKTKAHVPKKTNKEAEKISKIDKLKPHKLIAQEVSYTSLKEEIDTAEISERSKEVTTKVDVTNNQTTQVAFNNGIDFKNIPKNPLVSIPSFSKPPKSLRYPTLARKRGQQGTVWLEIWLNELGQQTKRVVSESSGVSILDSAALEAVSQWEFMPHTQANITVASRVKIPIEFVLN